jgi:hypothetical protein
MIKLKIIKILIKGQKKQIKNKKRDQTKINISDIEKNHKFNLNDKIINFIVVVVVVVIVMIKIINLI